ncbi:shikimate dehydrogenase family protein [Pararhizobium haloflavum]|uniref:shikimate dehydrogenase family protein n=1 Tax=Pararhizobium haloflavum TaxID=2037914 RepID=UPI0012FFF5D1|nr:shikimate dehydrogenase [Pararhizobium haloflavum]
MPTPVIDGAARVVFMLGSPIAQAQSPVLFNRYFRENAMNRVMVPLEVRPASLSAFLTALRGAANCDGAVLTLPLKRPACALVDEMTERARVLASVNVIRRSEDGRLHGDMVDGPGFWAGAGRSGFRPQGASIALAGAGAAGTAIAYSFAEMGGRHIDLLCEDAGDVERVGAIIAPFGTTIGKGMPQTLENHDLVINATPVGMAHLPGSLFPKTLLRTMKKGSAVADAITDPVSTELLSDAKDLGLVTIEGRLMTAGQFELLARWLGVHEGTSSAS